MQNNNNNPDKNSKEMPRVLGPRVSALDVGAPALTQPFKRLVAEGFITKLTVVFTPNGFNVECVPDKRISEVENSGLTAGVSAPIGMVLAASDKGNLIPVSKKTGKKQEQPKPEKTLVLADFELPEAQFIARCKAVAEKCGGATLTGRVRSAGAFNEDTFTSTISYTSWWEKANVKSRMVGLVQGELKNKLTKEQCQKFSKMSCPFRGDVVFQVKALEKEAEASSNGAKLSNPAGPEA